MFYDGLYITILFNSNKNIIPSLVVSSLKYYTSFTFLYLTQIMTAHLSIQKYLSKYKKYQFYTFKPELKLHECSIVHQLNWHKIKEVRSYQNLKIRI